MSRCYPYPPPGYEKKAKDTPVDVALPSKVQKEKHKHRDKDHKDKDHKEKKKRKREGDTNGDAHDKDKRSSKLQRSAPVNELHTENGRVRPETKIATVVELAVPDSGARGADARTPPISEPLLATSTVRQPSGGSEVYNRNKELANGKVESSLPPSIVLPKPPSGSSTCHPADEDVAGLPRIPVDHHIDGSSKKKQSSVGVVKQLPQEDWVDKALRDIDVAQQNPSSAAIDSEDWLFRSDRLHSKPKAQVDDVRVEKEVEQNGAIRVEAEAVYLPSVGMYALPYVIPF